MPRANPSASFPVAVRHLFRHLDEPLELRRNPLVAEYFARPSSAASAETDLDALFRIRSAISDGAARCEREEREAGREHRARKVARIFEQFYVRGASYREGARALGLSIQQYFREKRSLCLRIAGILSQRSCDDSSPSLWGGVVEARLEIAERRAAIGDFSGALHVYAEIATQTSSTAAAVRALCLTAAVERQRGNLLPASSRLQEAEALLAAASEISTVDALVSRCHIKLEQARIAFDGPNSAEGLRIAEDALRLALTSGCLAEPLDEATLIDVLLECGEQREGMGDFTGALRLATRAAERSASLPGSFPQRSHALSFESRLQWVVPNIAGRRNAAIRIGGLRGALDVTRGNGSIENVIRVLSHLTTAYMLVGNFREMIACGRRALTIAADFGAPRVEAMARLEFAETLLSTPNWRLANAVLTGLADRFIARSHNWTFCQFLEAVYLAKSKQCERSMAVAIKAERVASSSGFTRLAGALHREIASNAAALGRKSLAHERIQASVQAVQRNGSLLSLRHTYRIAASITHDARYASAAREITRSLAL